MPVIASREIPVDIKDVPRLDTTTILCGNGELFDISLPEAVFCWFEKAKIDLVAACGFLHFIDGNHGSGKGG